MHPSSIIDKVESKYPVETIIARGVPVWEFLRNIYSDKLFKEQCHYMEEKGGINPKQISNALYNYFWMRQNRNKNFHVVLFTDALEERIVEGLIKDKIAAIANDMDTAIIIINKKIE